MTYFSNIHVSLPERANTPIAFPGQSHNRLTWNKFINRWGALLNKKYLHDLHFGSKLFLEFRICGLLCYQKHRLHQSLFSSIVFTGGDSMKLKRKCYYSKLCKSFQFSWEQLLSSYPFKHFLLKRTLRPQVNSGINTLRFPWNGWKNLFHNL